MSTTPTGPSSWFGESTTPTGSWFGDSPVPTTSLDELREDPVDIVAEIVSTLQRKPGSKLSLHAGILNTINCLVGVGLLTIPFAFSLTGWVVGFILLFLFCIMTLFTANLIVETIDMCYYTIGLVEPKTPRKLASLTDMAEIALGPIGKHVTSLIFALELFSTSVGLLLLFSDTFEALFPGLLRGDFLRIIAVVLVLPTIYTRSLKLLSIVSYIGIVSLVFAVIILFFDGLWVQQGPGSLIDPAKTLLWPESFSNVCVAMGLLFVGFHAHSVIPSFNASMKDPSKFPYVLSFSYAFACILYAFVGICGYRMFGSSVLAEVTNNLPLISNFIVGLNKTVLFCVMISPLTKLGLMLTPVNNLVESIFGISRSDDPLVRQKKRLAPYWRYFSRTVIISAVLGVSIAYPSFQDVMGILGSLLAVSIVVVVPCFCFLVISTRTSLAGYAKRPTRLKMILVGLTLFVGTIVLILGTMGALVFKANRS